MKLSQFILGSLLVFFSVLGLYAGLTTQPKNGLGITFYLFLLFLAVIYLRGDLKDKISHNTLDIDAEAEISFRNIIALVIIGLDAFICYNFLHGGTALLVFFLVFFGAIAYASSDPAPGIYKNGKYLGAVYKGFIKVGDNLTLGETQDTEAIGFLKILKDGKEVAKLYLTAEGFMELKPDKIWEVFPEVKGKIERFGNMFKVGDYTLEYNLLSPSKNISYSSYYDDENRKRRLSPTYSSHIQNIHHR